MVERTVEIEAPIETVYQVVSNLEAYPEFLDTTKDVKTEMVEGKLQAEFFVNVIKEIRYRLEFQFQEPTGLTWSFIDGEMMKDNTGGWRLEKLSDSRTRATYFVDVQFGWMVPKKIVNLLTETQLPSLMQAFKSRAERKASQ